MMNDRGDGAPARLTPSVWCKHAAISSRNRAVGGIFDCGVTPSGPFPASRFVKTARRYHAASTFQRSWDITGQPTKGLA